MKYYLVPVLLFVQVITFGQLTPKLINNGKEVIGFYEFKPAGYNPDSSYQYPVIIFLHGIGERGNGTTELPMALNSSFPKYLVRGATMQFVIGGRQHAFLVLLPQMSKDYENWQNFYIDAMIDYARKNLKIDSNRIFLTGWSLGGGGAWKYATSSVENARKLAGIIPVSPAPDYTDLCNLARGKVAVWTHHARDDASVPLHYSEDAITGIKTCSPDIIPMITYYPHGGHPYVAEWAYDTLNKIQYPNMYQWMVGTTRANSLAINQAPVARAGNDTIVILPSTSITLDGRASFDPNDVITQYRWIMVAGPPSPGLNIKQPDFPDTRITGFEPGKYTFRLSVTDQFGVNRADEVNVEVRLPAAGINAAPVVDAGPDVQIRETSYYLKGSGRDYDGTITGYYWRQVSGPVSATVEGNRNTANISGMTHTGTYGIELSACDNHDPCGTGRDTVFITKLPLTPVYFNYWSGEDPAIKNPGIHLYGLVAIFMMVVTLPALIFNRFMNRNLIYKCSDIG